jgi:hypothetical protein
LNSSGHVSFGNLNRLMDPRVKPRDDGGNPTFPGENALIPGLRNGLIMRTPCLFEGVVDRDA